MDIQPIIHFLKGIRENNNRDWFQAHKSEFNDCRKEFEEGIAQLILRISAFDEEIANQRAADCIYRFYRDLRFTQDKTPYKRHFGAYICQKGRKSLRGGYYVHIEPDKCLLAGGCYYLPNNILTACRNEILANSDEWLACVANKKFVNLFGEPNKGTWDEDEISEKGFGLSALKTSPKGFPTDTPLLPYLRMKDYCCWKTVPESFFASNNWIEQAAEIFQTAKPMADFINAVVDDYL